MTADEQAPASESTDLLVIAQNQKASAEALEKILDEPELPPEVLMALLRNPQTPGMAMARLAERATGPLLDLLLGGLQRIARWPIVLEALLANPAVAEVRKLTIRHELEVARKREMEGDRKKKSLLLMIKDLPVGQRLALAKKGNKDVPDGPDQGQQRDGGAGGRKFDPDHRRGDPVRRPDAGHLGQDPALHRQ